MSNTFGGVVKLQGESEYRKALQQITSNLSEVNSEMKILDATYDKNDKSVETLTAKNQGLTKKLSEQQKRVDELTKALEDAKEETGENSATTQKWQTELNKAQAEVIKTNKAIEKNVSAMKDQGKQVKDTSEAFSKAGETMKSWAKGIATAFAGLTAGLVALEAGTRDYRENMNKLSTAFESTGKTADQAKDVYEELYAVLGDSDKATEATQLMSNLVKNEKDMANWTTIATGVFGRFGDSLPIEGLIEASNETAKVGKVTGVLADALNWVGISEDDFNIKLSKCSTEQERNKLITETLSKTYTESAKNYQKNAKGIIESNKASQQLTDCMAKLGEVIAPLIAQVKTLAADAIGGLTKFVQDNQPQINAFVSSIKEFGNFLIQNKDVIIGTLLGIGTALLGFKVAGIITAVTTALNGMTLAQYALNLAMSLNPIGLVIVAIGALVAAGYILIKNWDEIKEGAQNLWASIKTIFNSIKNWIVDKFNGIIDFLKGLPKAMLTIGANMFKGLWNGLKSVWTSIKDWVEDKINWIKNIFNSAVDSASKSAETRANRTASGSRRGNAYSHWSGISYIPYDEYPAVLHKGERVLTASENREYSSGSSQEVISLLKEYLPKLGQNQIVLDSGTLVGEIAPGMNNELNRIRRWNK